MATAANERLTTSNYVALLKDAVATLRDLALFLLAVLLLVFPSTFNTMLTNAGFEEGSIVGMKWKRGLVDTNQKLKLASDTIAMLTTERDQLRKSLATLQSQTNNPQQKRAIEALDAGISRSDTSVRDVQTTVRATLATNAVLVAASKVIAAVAPGTSAPPASGFCYQEDKLQPGPQRFGMLCYSDKRTCETVRGPNPHTRQSACEAVALDGAVWSPRYPGYMHGWYELRATPFATPFPQLPRN